MTAATFTAVSEVRRLRAELAELRRLAVALVDATDHEAEIAYRLLLCREAFDRGRDAGWAAGFEAAHREMAAAWNAAAAPIARGGLVHAEVEEKRWMLRGEPRTRGTFGRPHLDDFPGRGEAA